MESAIVSLKAELLRKRLEASSNLTERKHNLAKNKLLKRKKLSEASISAGKDSIEESLKDEEDEDVLAKSKSMLEKKSALYEQIKTGVHVLEDDDLNEKFLVNFQKKIVDEVNDERLQMSKNEGQMESDDELQGQRSPPAAYKSTREEDEWVDYIDVFGRTRTCQKKDIEYLKKLDRGITGPPPKPEDPQSQKLKEKWSKIEDESRTKRDVHYQDVLFDEARDHGVGFMQFSRNEVERESQRNLLMDLRAESKKAGAESHVAKRKRDKKMEERLAKVRQRKRLKLGLPTKDLEEKKLMTPPSSDDESKPEAVNDSNSSVAPPTVQESRTQKKTFLVREWDMGKEMDPCATLTQTQWVESRRKVRDTDFAPPMSYSSTHKSNSQYSFKSHSNMQSSYTNSNAPQSSLFNSHREYDKKTELPTDDSPSSSNINIEKSHSYEEEPKQGFFSSDGHDHPSSGNLQSNKYSAFAPPATFEYFGPTVRKSHGKTKNDLEKSIEKGLASLRNAGKGDLLNLS